MSLLWQHLVITCYYCYGSYGKGFEVGFASRIILGINVVSQFIKVKVKFENITALYYYKSKVKTSTLPYCAIESEKIVVERFSV